MTDGRKKVDEVQEAEAALSAVVESQGPLLRQIRELNVAGSTGEIERRLGDHFARLDRAVEAIAEAEASKKAAKKDNEEARGGGA